MTQAINQRPARTFITGRATTWIRVAANLLTVMTALTVAIGYAWLPDSIPTHFNLAGQPDAWGSKGSVWMLVVVNIVIVGGLTLLSRYPKVFNYPAPVTEENAQTLYRAGEQMMVWLACLVAILFAAIVASTLFGFNVAPILVPTLIAVFLSLIVGLARMMKV